MKKEIRLDAINFNVPEHYELPRVKNSLNAHVYPKKYRKFYLPSLTIPDQAPSLKQILEQHAKGIPFDVQKLPVYHGEDNLPDFKKLDLTEIHELALRNKEIIDKMQKDLQEQQRQKMEELEQQRINEIVQKRLQEVSPNTKQPE